MSVDNQEVQPELAEAEEDEVEELEETIWTTDVHLVNGSVVKIFGEDISFDTDEQCVLTVFRGQEITMMVNERNWVHVTKYETLLSSSNPFNDSSLPSTNRAVGVFGETNHAH